jgi:hypothetical protein
MKAIKPKVFIQTNKKQELGALLSRYSLISNSKRPDAFDVELMMVENLPQLMKRHGQSYLRHGQKVLFNRYDLQSFTMTRFLPPSLMNFQGRAVVIDPDVFALGGVDIMNLLERDMHGKAILACSAGGQKFKTSVMLLDCAKLKHWDWEKCVEEIFSFKRDYRSWVNLELEPADSVGILEEEWNHCDILNEKTKLIHYTRRLTQPWKTGLKVDFQYDLPQSKIARIRQLALRPLKILLGKETKFRSKYQENPFPEQKKFFFQLVSRALSENELNKEFIIDNVKNGYVRSDIFEVLDKVGR